MTLRWRGPVSLLIHPGKRDQTDREWLNEVGGTMGADVDVWAGRAGMAEPSERTVGSLSRGVYPVEERSAEADLQVRKPTMLVGE